MNCQVWCIAGVAARLRVSICPSERQDCLVFRALIVLLEYLRLFV